MRLPCPLEPDIHADVMVQWQQEGFGLGFDPDLPEYNRYKYNRSDGYCNMVIDQVHLTDSGVYTCTIYTGILLTYFIYLTQTPIKHQMASIDINQYFSYIVSTYQYI